MRRWRRCGGAAAGVCDEVVVVAVAVASLDPDLLERLLRRRRRAHLRAEPLDRHQDLGRLGGIDRVRRPLAFGLAGHVLLFRGHEVARARSGERLAPKMLCQHSRTQRKPGSGSIPSIGLEQLNHGWGLLPDFAGEIVGGQGPMAP
eukprot:scaffold78159_cov64-Phaeocystis_antarctica.AAC.2